MPKPLRLKISLVCILTTSIFICCCKTSAQSRISGISARLFYNQKSDQDRSRVDTVSGTFSKKDVSTGEFALWNTIIGEGDAQGPSNQTIVIVAVKSIKYANKPQTLRFTVGQGKKIIQRESREFDVIGDDVNYKLLFLLNDTGCGKLTVRADLLIKGKIVSTLSKTIDFECGE
jgi:hypothetical protein